MQHATVKENRAYVKGGGSCINVDDLAYKTRVTRLRAENAKDGKIRKLENELSELKALVQTLIQGNEK